LSEGETETLMAQMRKRLTPQPIKVRADIEVTCFNYEGIDAIQRALLAGQAVSSEDTTVRIKLIAPPLYVMTTSTLDKVAGLKSLNDAIEQIKFNIEKEGGQLTIKTAPKVLLLSALVLLRENSHHVANLCFTAAACTSI
jgi:translation initiation factor 2 subunit 1